MKVVNLCCKIHFNSKNTNLQVFLQKDFTQKKWQKKRGNAMLATGEK
jgi:hypothetical protein